MTVWDHGHMRRAWGRAAPPLVLAAVSLGALVGAAGATPATNDPYLPEQWALTRIGAPAAWGRSTGAGVRIGVIDTGVDLQHEDLAAKVVASTSCVGANDIADACTGSAQDDQGHGTHVAGIAAAVTGNAKGIAAVAPDAQLVAVKALSASGSGALNDVNAGIEWAVNHGARVVNLSLEADGSQVTLAAGQSLREGVEYAWAHKAIPVIAAGNSTPSLFGAAGYGDVDAVVVGATGRNDEVAWYSSPLAKAKWGLVAPGGDARAPDGRASCAGALAADCIVSTGWFPGRSNQYADDEGTSMAAPQVAGVLALLLAQGLTPEAAIARMLGTTVKVACGDGCHGRVDAAAAVGASSASGAPTSTTRAPSVPGAVRGPTTTSAAPAVTGGLASPVGASPPSSAPLAPARGQLGLVGPPSPSGPVVTLQPAPPPPLQAIGVPHRSQHRVPAVLVIIAVLLLVGVAAEGALIGRRSRLVA